MTVYIAMLRGVNVGGNSLKMEWLRAACEEMGLRNARTYVQSGNIVFGSGLGAAKLAKMLKETVDAQTRLPVPVVVRSAAEFRAVVAGNPFLKKKGVDTTKLHVTFLGDTPKNPDTLKLYRDMAHLGLFLPGLITGVLTAAASLNAVEDWLDQHQSAGGSAKTLA